MKIRELENFAKTLTWSFKNKIKTINIQKVYSGPVDKTIKLEETIYKKSREQVCRALFKTLRISILPFCTKGKKIIEQRPANEAISAIQRLYSVGIFVISLIA